MEDLIKTEIRHDRMMKKEKEEKEEQKKVYDSGPTWRHRNAANQRMSTKDQRVNDLSVVS